MEQISNQPLNESDAREVADMMKVKLQDEPGRTNYLMPRTVEEYDKALAVVEKIKRMAEQEPFAEKVLYDIARLAVESHYGVLAFLRYLDDQTLTNEEMGTKERILKSYENASKKLRDLKEEVKKYN